MEDLKLNSGLEKNQIIIWLLEYPDKIYVIRKEYPG